MAPVTPKLAATVMLLRDSAAGPEIFVQQRVGSMKFAANMTVFPGGGVDPRDFEANSGVDPRLTEQIATRLSLDAATTQALLCAAVRETFEETGTLLVAAPSGSSHQDCDSDPAAPTAQSHHFAPGRYQQQRLLLQNRTLSLTDFLHDSGLHLAPELLQPWARWVTPEFNPIRYDTYFFLAAHPPGQLADGETSEARSVGWYRPGQLLEQWRRHEISLMPPTWAELTRIQQASSVTEALEQARANPVRQTTTDFVEAPFMQEYFRIANHSGLIHPRPRLSGAGTQAPEE